LGDRFVHGNLLWQELCGGSDFSAALCADFVPKARKAISRSASRLSGSFRISRRAGFRRPLAARIYLRLRAALFDRVVRPFDRDCDVRFVRDAVGRAVFLRPVVRAVLRDGLRRFVAVLRRAVDLRPVDLRVVFPADVLRDAVLRPLVLRPVALRPDVFRPDVLRVVEDLRPEDAAVLPVRSRRFVRARLRLFSVGLS
jgi:hypothetical protein